jgi:hypothetical protein
VYVYTYVRTWRWPACNGYSSVTTQRRPTTEPGHGKAAMTFVCPSLGPEESRSASRRIEKTSYLSPVGGQTVKPPCLSSDVDASRRQPVAGRGSTDGGGDRGVKRSTNRATCWLVYYRRLATMCIAFTTEGGFLESYHKKRRRKYWVIVLLQC